MSNDSLSNGTQPSSQQLSTESVRPRIIKKPRQARHILPEEEYTETLSSIITRDYFPALLHRTGSVAGQRAARLARLHEEEELARIEQEAEEVAWSHKKDSSQQLGIRETPRPLHRESVDGFHERVTSEDNEEFERKMRKESQNRKERMQFIYNSCGVEASKVGEKLRIMNGQDPPPHANNIPSHPMIDDDSLVYASDQFNPPRATVHVAGTSQDGKHSITFTNSLFFPPVLESATEPCSSTMRPLAQFISKPSRPLIAQSHTNTENIIDSKRLLMPPPTTFGKATIHHKSFTTNSTALTLLTEDHETAASFNPMELVEYIAKPIHDTEKKIVPSQTRFPHQSLLPHPVSSLTHDIMYHRGDSWSDVDSVADYSTDLDEPLGSIELERRKRKRTLDRQRNTFVAMTPLILPGQEASIHSSSNDDGNSSPIMTWGQVASTPLVIGGSSSSTMAAGSTKWNNTNTSNKSEFKTFVFAKEDPSEKIARLAEDTLAKKARRYKDAGTFRSKEDKADDDDRSIKSSSTTSTTNSHSIRDRLKTLTPKAQLLLKGFSSSSAANSKVNATPRSRSAFGTALRESYSSTPSISRKDKQQQLHSSDMSSQTRNISLKNTPLLKRV